MAVPAICSVAEMQKVAIIGAGLAGVTVANAIQGQAEVRLFEKSRGLAGRMSTRRQDEFTFDHGAQYFTMKTVEFAAAMARFEAAGTVAPWPAPVVGISREGEMAPRPIPRQPMVATPSMTGLVKAMAAELDCRTGQEITAICRQDEGWKLISGEEDIWQADWVILAIPAPQVQRLIPPEQAMRAQLEVVKMQGCFTLMLGFDSTLDLPFGAAFPEDSLIGFIADNSSRPGRDGPTALTVQSTNAWAEEHLDDETGSVVAAMGDELSRLIGVNIGEAVFERLHRWRYAATAVPLGQPYLMDAEQRLAAAGDWCIAGRVEAAWQSGHALAGALARTLANQR